MSETEKCCNCGNDAIGFRINKWGRFPLCSDCYKILPDEGQYIPCTPYNKLKEVQSEQKHSS